jgi:hypothetical protein
VATRKSAVRSLERGLAAEERLLEERVAKAEGLLGIQHAGGAPGATGLTRLTPPPKPRIVRDTMTMPDSDYALITDLKHRLMRLDVEINKSEVLRAGLHALNAMDDAALKGIAETVERIRRGRKKELYE